MGLEGGQLGEVVICAISMVLSAGILLPAIVYAVLRYRRNAMRKRLGSQALEEAKPPMLALSPSIGTGELSIDIQPSQVETPPRVQQRGYRVSRSITLTAIDEEAADIKPLPVSASCLSFATSSIATPSPARLATARRVSISAPRISLVLASPSRGSRYSASTMKTSESEQSLGVAGLTPLRLASRQTSRASSYATARTGDTSFMTAHTGGTEEL